MIDESEEQTLPPLTTKLVQKQRQPRSASSVDILYHLDSEIWILVSVEWYRVAYLIQTTHTTSVVRARLIPHCHDDDTPSSLSRLCSSPVLS